jgi:hypothetical protein
LPCWLGGAVFAFQRYHGAMDVYDKGILLATVPAAIWLGWLGARCSWLVAALSLLAIVLYDGDLRRGDTVFWPQVLPVQPVGHPVDEHAVLHEHGLLLDRHVRARPAAALEGLGSKLAWWPSRWRWWAPWCAGTRAT